MCKVVPSPSEAAPKVTWPPRPHHLRVVQQVWLSSYLARLVYAHPFRPAHRRRRIAIIANLYIVHCPEIRLKIHRTEIQLDR
jgi:hypothetical protein